MAALQSGVVVLADAADTVAADRPLSGRQRPLVSNRGKFALGFFQPENSEHWYLGTWYNQISKHTPVWVANRGTPISNPDTSQLTIATDGNMVLLDNSTTAIWSTNISNFTSNSTVGVILDSGNLVLADASNTSIILWQSFDHFGDTWLPGGKLGRNKLTGVSTRLVAWKARNDPVPGVFSLELDPNGTSQYLLQWNSTLQYWTSGNWTGRIFTGVPEMTPTGSYPNSLYTFDYVNGENESYFVYDLKDDSVLTRFVLGEMGQIQFLTWMNGANDWMLFWSQPKAQCDVYSLCGPFSVCTENAMASCSCLRGFGEQNVGEWLQGDHTSGCRRNVELQCSSNGSVVGRSTDRFYTMVGRSTDCSCTAYSYNGSCSLWYRDLINLQDVSVIGSQGSNAVLIRLAASELSSQKQKHAKKLITFSVLATGAVLLMMAVLVVILRRRVVKATHEWKEQGGAAVDGLLPLLAASTLGGGGGGRDELVSAVVDGRVGVNADMGEVERACRVACWCIQDDEKARPAMATVVQVLEGLVEIGVPPVPRSLQILADLANQSNNLQFFSDLPSK
ncbi:hypothetical protein OsI_04595 [Oryza sativa Indica Group]|uniref:non-specific serine/threonine protein kinase n=1 Tax=Oryza sativa subsp. indica TaxID=39946 RepID=B8A6Z3_ORYSI|nr:hypothetical protein OsI_04595 [Oryza sativa Indica Group]